MTNAIKVLLQKRTGFLQLESTLLPVPMQKKFRLCEFYSDLF
jgi:hypothetical protein